jgi:hypothetical protein
MAKAVRIGMAGQSTGVEPSLIHPGDQDFCLTSTAKRASREGQMDDVAAATRRSRKTAPKTCCTEIRFTYPRRLPRARPGLNN